MISCFACFGSWLFSSQMTPGSNVVGRFPKRGHAHFHVIPFPLRSQFERTAVLPRGSGEKGSGVLGRFTGRWICTDNGLL